MQEITAYPQKAVESLAKRVRQKWLEYQDFTGAQGKTKVTQTELADKLDVTQPALNQFFQGTTPLTIEMLLNICNRINIDPWEMVQGNSFYEPKLKRIAQSLGRSQGQSPTKPHFSVNSDQLSNIQSVLADPPSDVVRLLLATYSRAEIVTAIITKKIP